MVREISSRSGQHAIDLAGKHNLQEALRQHPGRWSRWTIAASFSLPLEEWSDVEFAVELLDELESALSVVIRRSSGKARIV